MKKLSYTVLFILSMTYSWGQTPCDSLNIVSTGGSNQAFLEVSLNLCCLPGPIDSWTTTSNNGTVLGQDTMSITHNIHNLNPVTTIPFDTLNTCLTYSWTSNNVMTCCVTWIWDGLNWINTNNVNGIEEINSTKLSKYEGKKLIVSEVVFSMDGDSPDFDKLFKVAKESKSELLIDEAHSFGIVGSNGVGLISNNDKINSCLCTIYPLGKAFGLSGCFVAGSQLMIDFLINFSRSFIYSTGPSKQHVLQVKKQLQELANKTTESIFELKNYFTKKLDDKCSFVSGPNSTIVSLIVSGNENAKALENELYENGFFVKAILSPTVAKGSERLRICIHDFNTKSQLSTLAKLINKLL